MRATTTALLLAGLLVPTMALASKVTVTTDPAGATVQLDGVSVGVSPVTITKVSQGTHLLKVSKEGYVTREDSIDVDGDSDFQIHAPLNPAPKLFDPKQPDPHRAPPSSSPPPPQPLVRVEAKPVKTLVLVVETVPADAFVQVIGQTEVKRSPATFSGFSAGTVLLVVRANGYQDKRVEIDLKQDSRTRVVLDPAR